MFAGRHWMDRNLARVGLIMFGVGLFLLILGTIGVFVELVTGSPQWQFGAGPWGFLKEVLYVARFEYGLGALLAPIGAAFYCLGRFLEVGLVTIVGFEKTPPSELIVKGPDDQNIVWIGKPYKNAVDAELAARAFSQRIGRTA
jgi:hypothetical protein